MGSGSRHPRARPCDASAALIRPDVGGIRRAGSLLLLLLLGCGSVLAAGSSVGTLVAGAETGPSFALVPPDPAAEPYRCIERLDLPAVDNALEASWAPDSAHLAYTKIIASTSTRTVTGFEEDPGLGILDVRTGGISWLGAGKGPEWSGSGSYLSFWRNGHVLIIQAGRIAAIVEPTMPTVRWVGDQLVYFRKDEIRGWTEADDVAISLVSYDYMPRYPHDWTDFSADGQLFTLTRYRMDGSAERYVGETRTGQIAPLSTPGTTYTEWGPAGETLLVRSADQVELRGANGWDAVAAVSAFPGVVHGWTADGTSLLMGRVTPTIPAGPSFDRFAVWDGRSVTAMATLPNLLGSRRFSPDGRLFAGVARAGLYESTLEVYRCGSNVATAPSRADPVSRARQQRIDTDPRRFVRPVIGYFAQFLQGAHSGVDVAAPFGSIITADDDGDVTYVGWRPVGGRAVCVQHAGGLETCDYHTSLALVSVGQHVARGEPVALIGMTGVTTGPHVHWEAKLNGLIVDPLKR